MTRTVIARWESRRGKDWVEVYEQDSQFSGMGYGYDCRNGGGWMGSNITREDALATIGKRVAAGVFCSQNSPMRRVV